MTLIIQKPTGAKLAMAKDYIPVDPHFASVSLLLHGNGTNGSTAIIDSSPNPKVVTVTGSASISTTQSKFGGSSLVAGSSPDFAWSNSVLTVPPGSDFAYGLGDYTIEAWVYRTANHPNGGLIFAQTNSGTNYFTFGWSDINVYHGFATSGGGVAAVSATATLNQWVHVAAVRVSGVSICFTNGVAGSPISNTVNFSDLTSRVPTIGAYSHAVAQLPHRGYIDELRITKGVARYSGNFTPPTAPFPDIASR